MRKKKQTHNYRREALAILLVIFSIFLTLCLVSYHPADPAFNSVSNIEKIQNLGGVVGAYIADFLFVIFGISAYVVVGVLFTVGLSQLIGRKIKPKIGEAIAYSFLLIFIAALIHIFFETITIHGHLIAGGGIIGGLLGEISVHYLNTVGAVLVLLAGCLVAFMLATHITPSMLLKKIYAGLKKIGTGLITVFSNFGETMYVTSKKIPLVLKKIFEISKQLLTRNQPVPASAPAKRTIPNTANRNVEKPAKTAVFAKPSPATAGPKILDRADLRTKKSAANQLKFDQMDGYNPPPISLLDMNDKPKLEVDEDALKKQSLYLEQKLTDFNVKGNVTAIHPGPVITMYEFEPAIGTKINQITNLEDDLALALGGRSVRVLPHLPGKAAVGIEVPNNDREIVSLRDIISSHPFEKSHSKLSIALGAMTDGRPMVTDLTKMPHLLVAGATGSGKSVAIHSMIASLLFKCSPEDLRLILIDPKMLELSTYNGIPHLMLPVVTKPKKSILAMRWAVKEMERRYRLLSNGGARNIIGYNEKVRSGELDLVSEDLAQQMLQQDKEATPHTGPLPYIVIIIDELADLMMTVSNEMEETITRLAQMARAAGIHLILATQRPSVDVITGLIKANFPARIAFRTSARHDSRTILDAIGAETLLGCGDMLFMTPSGGKMVRVHGSFLSEKEVNRIVEHLKKQGAPVYNEEILTAPKETANGFGEIDEEDHEIYDQAIALIAETKQASISMLQRRMRIGYNRAARLIEKMEADGVVGPADGSKPREVLITDIAK